MMRNTLLATTLFLLVACGGPETSQANNSAANISNDARPAATAKASTTTTNAAMFAPAPSKEAALKIMHDRHEGMEAIGKANKLIKQELNASSPNLQLVRSTAYRMASLSKDASGWFAAGTGPELGKTGAKPEIWQNQADVAAKLGAFQRTVQAFSDTAAGTDIGAIKGRFAELSGTCKACHDKYRSQMHH
jgi:cytochrome c556